MPAFGGCLQALQRKVMSQRLAQAVREAEQRGLLGFTEAEALKKEFPL